MKHLITSAIIAFLFSSSSMFSQNENRRFGTQIFYNALDYNDGLVYQALQEFNVSNNEIELPEEEITIPVVFHVVYSSEKNKISEEQIMSQLSALNRDFSLEEAKGSIVDESKFKSIIPSSTGIKFCLAEMEESSIVYKKSSIAEWAMDNNVKFNSKGGSKVVTPKSILNIWVTDLSKTSGYAQMPSGPARTDGIVIDYEYFGTMGTARFPYNEGKTLTHLVGNYLGLYDLWNERLACVDDFVDDTPIHNSPNYGCPEFRHYSACGNYPAEMHMNFMDNTNDACMCAFTIGQKDRMLSMLAPGGLRAGLLTGKTTCQTEERSQEESSPKLGALTVSPNPARHHMDITINVNQEGEYLLQVYAISGALKYKETLSLSAKQSVTKLSCANWLPGVYLIQLNNQSDQLIQKVVVTQ